MFDFSENKRNDDIYKAISERLTAERSREQIKRLKTYYCKLKDSNGTSEPTVVHGNLMTRDGTCKMHQKAQGK